MTFDFRARRERIQELLKKEGLDAFVTVTVEANNKNPYYLSGFGGTTGALAISQKGAVLAVDARYTARAQGEAVGVEVIEVPRGQLKGGYLSQYVQTALSGLGITPAQIGFEAERVPVLMAQAFEEHIKGVWVPTKHVVERLRQVKDAEEIKYLTRAARLTSTVFTEVSKKIRAGMRECDVATSLDIALRNIGALGNSFETIVASGPNAAIPHHETSTRKIKAGEPVIMDFGGIFPGGYCSDLTRTIFVTGKKPDKKLLDMYAVTLAANKKAFRALKTGMIWKEYDGVARSYIEEKGYGKYFSHGLGHSLGLETHDPYDYAHDAFTVGSVITNEPGIYIPNVGGIRIEDDVVVTKEGAKRLTNAPYLSL